jgi:hypothetical protein
MRIGWLWLALATAWSVNLLLLVWLVRFRLEVWANRRVIASLEAVAHRPKQKDAANRTIAVGWMLVLVVVGYFLLVVIELWS